MTTQAIPTRTRITDAPSLLVLARLKDFARAATELQRVWDGEAIFDSHAAYDDSLTPAYPFERSFDEVVSGINQWLDVVESPSMAWIRYPELGSAFKLSPDGHDLQGMPMDCVGNLDPDPEESHYVVQWEDCDEPEPLIQIMADLLAERGAKYEPELICAEMKRLRPQWTVEHEYENNVSVQNIPGEHKDLWILFGDANVAFSGDVYLNDPRDAQPDHYLNTLRPANYDPKLLAGLAIWKIERWIDETNKSVGQPEQPPDTAHEDERRKRAIKAICSSPTSDPLNSAVNEVARAINRLREVVAEPGHAAPEHPLVGLSVRELVLLLV